MVKSPWNLALTLSHWGLYIDTRCHICCVFDVQCMSKASSSKACLFLLGSDYATARPASLMLVIGMAIS